MATETKWHIQGEYLESCNCEVLCPCSVPGSPLISDHYTVVSICNQCIAGIRQVYRS
ncbi:uncharacterized protein METZ01_LOCUS474952 [marine metagenome]|uniref:DUF1326 domain-containing protein n=1 Tax=marine metagenome TaxID=408172 RepID=A0A383BRW3_9ZZZZ